MKTTPSDEPPHSEDDLAAEYVFDYGKAKPNRFAAQDKERKTIVVLDEDVSQVFSTSEAAVNKVLRALIEAMP
ncbi:MAG: hypothetical protein LH660_07530 [Phormidesmis sp. CAN_BIN36]|nr:hypothetical protein [Phormidesmis sp. CAN_BIN36]